MNDPPKGMPAIWQEGYKAAMEDNDDLLSERCPYEIASDAWELWYAGAEAAQNEMGDEAQDNDDYDNPFDEPEDDE